MDPFNQPTNRGGWLSRKTSDLLLDFSFSPAKLGEYWRILPPGSYRIWAVKNNQETAKQFIQVTNERYKTAKVLDLIFAA